MQKTLALEMVLCDERGGKIHAVVRRTLVYKFQSTLIEGAAYSISNFGVGENSDIMGVLTDIGTEKEYERNRKKFRMNVMELEIDGSKIECALFENYLDDLNAFLASGNTTNVVVVVQLAKVKSFKGKVSLQNALHATKLFFNPDFDKLLEENTESVSQPLSQIAEAPKMSIEEEFLTHTINKTIEELKDAASLLDINCSDLLESTVQSNDKHFPAEISALVDKTFLFKVENKIVSNSWFETSYK
ncbi:Nucleic acid-binding, OB-fold, partial [Sesbania bispinosa]